MNVKIDNSYSVAFTLEKLFLYHICTVYFSSQFEIKLTINSRRNETKKILLFFFFLSPLLFPYEIIIYTTGVASISGRRNDGEKKRKEK